MRLVNFVKEMFVLKDVVSTLIVPTIWHALKGNVKTRVLKINVVKKLFVARQTIVPSVFVPTALQVNQQSSAFRLNANLTPTVI